MALCINDSGTWRNITTLCVNDSGTWRNVATGCINQSGTWRRFLDPFVLRCPLGSVINCGWVICRSGGVAWLIGTNQVKRPWNSRGDGPIAMQAQSGCSGWFVPSTSQMSNPAFACRTYWGYITGGSSKAYWTNTEISANNATCFSMANGGTRSYAKYIDFYIAAFRCVTY